MRVFHVVEFDLGIIVNVCNVELAGNIVFGATELRICLGMTMDCWPGTLPFFYNSRKMRIEKRVCGALRALFSVLLFMFME